jgi:type I restriction enzyme S subunit
MVLNSIKNSGLQPVVKLPTGWIWTTIGEISEAIQYGFTAKATVGVKGRPKLLRITDIQNESVDWDSVPYCEIDITRKKNYLLAEGDLVFARTGATVGKSYLIKGNFPEAIFASYLIRIVFKREINKTFVSYFFNSSQYWQQIRKGQLGIGQPNVNGQILSKIELPLPPIAEQNRIVTKIEELFSRLDAGIESLKKVKAQLEYYYQSVLKAAFEGGLTEEWRRAHERDIEPLSGLLGEVKSERRSKRDGRVKTSEQEIENGLPELPEAWAWERFGNVIDIIDYRGRTPPFCTGGVPHLRSSNIRNGKITWQGLKFISEESYQDYMTRGLPKQGDVLFTTEAPLGGVAFAPNIKFSVAQRVMILRPIEKVLSPGFLLYQIMSDSFQRRLKRRGTGTTVSGISSRNLKPLEVIIAPLIEQRVIVQHIDHCRSIIDRAGLLIDQSEKQLYRLRKQILKKAFEGGLVGQDPQDEPAAVLLDRLEATHVSQKGTSRKVPKKSSSLQMELRSYVE